MHVPITRRERDGESKLAVEQRQPYQYGQRRITCAEQEKRTEAVGQQRGTGVLAQARNGGHGHVLSCLTRTGVRRAPTCRRQCPLPGSTLPSKISGLAGPSTCRMPTKPRSIRESAWSTRT